MIGSVCLFALRAVRGSSSQAPGPATGHRITTVENDDYSSLAALVLAVNLWVSWADDQWSDRAWPFGQSAGLIRKEVFFSDRTLYSLCLLVGLR